MTDRSKNVLRGNTIKLSADLSDKPGPEGRAKPAAMDPKAEEDECARMLCHLQQYAPHLQKLIGQLKDPKRKNRELQLNKLEGLHSMITDRKKKLKLDTLKKCEDVILKILLKVNPNINKQLQPQAISKSQRPNPKEPRSMMKFVCKTPPETKTMPNISKEAQESNYMRFQAARVRLNELATPSSPSPPRDAALKHKPIVIPTEQVAKSDHGLARPSYNPKAVWVPPFHRNRPAKPYNSYFEPPENRDIYSQIAETLTSSPKRTTVFSRLGSKLDMSKPPLSAEDLEALTSPEEELTFNDMSINELKSLRQKIHNKLLDDSELGVKGDYNVSDLRNKLNSKNNGPSTSSFGLKTSTPRVEKVIKNPDSQFGSTLSSIDEQIFCQTEGGGKKDKKPHSKEEKHDKIRDKSRDKNSKKEHHRKKSKKSHKEEKGEHKKDKSDVKNKIELEIDKSLLPNKGHTEHKVKHEIKIGIRDAKLETNSKSSTQTLHEVTLESSPNAQPSTNQVYKRLADKYNPRPRKNSVEISDKKALPDDKLVAEIVQKLPVLENLFKKNQTESGLFNKPEIVLPNANNAEHTFSMNRAEVAPFIRSESTFTSHHKDKPSVEGAFPNVRTEVGPYSKATFELPRSDPRLHNEMKPTDPRKAVSTSWFEHNNASELACSNPHMPGKSPLLNITPPLQTSPIMGTPFLPNSSPNSMMPHGFVPPNNAIRKNDMMPSANQFIAPQRPALLPTPSHTSNVYMNQYMMPNNVSANLVHSQFNNMQTSQNNFHSTTSTKVFHPYEPVEGNGQYDLNRMHSTEFYSSTFNNKQTQPLLSPPSYAKCGPYNASYQPRDQQRPLYPSTARSKVDPWTAESKQHWQERNPSRERDESYRPVIRDPRIRAREMKQQQQQQQQPNKKSDEHAFNVPSAQTSQNKYDSLYSNLDKEKDANFLSPLDSLYSTNEKIASTAGKGYGFQKFKIPKKKTEAAEKKSENEALPQEEVKEEKQPGEETKEVEEPEKREAKDVGLEELKEEVPAEAEAQPPPSAPEASAAAAEPLPAEKANTESEPTTSASPEKSEEPSSLNRMAALLRRLGGKQKKEILCDLFNELAHSILTDDQEKKKFKRIQKFVESSDSEEEEKPVKKSKDEEKSEKIEKEVAKSPKEDIVEPEDDDEMEDADDGADEEELPKVAPKKKPPKKRPRLKKVTKQIKVRSKKIKQKPKKKGKMIKKVGLLKSNSLQENESVVETVGERIKNRRRNISTPTPKTRKCRSELDKLHADIKEMFIRDEVLTVTGKRTCRVSKQPDAETAAKPSKNKPEETISSPEQMHRLKTTDLKVVLVKTDINKLSNQRFSSQKSDSDSDLEDEPLESRLRALQQKERKKSTETMEDTTAPTKRAVKAKPNYVEESEDETIAEMLAKAGKQAVEQKETEAASDASKESPPKKGVKRKKRQKWASGVISKMSKKRAIPSAATPTPSLDEEGQSHVSDLEEQPEPMPDEESEIEFVEPDVNYYCNSQEKPECKICSYKGKMIVQHYRSVHPKHEVLISRISPDDAKKAIEEAVEKDFDDMEASQVDDMKGKQKRFTYQCRFCHIFFKNETPEYFFDHLTAHTGEYRFVCNICSFKTANNKSLRSHIHSLHSSSAESTAPIQPAYQMPSDSPLIFGYMCGECNFIQLDRPTIETHVKIYHLGDSHKIYKINMSMIEVMKPAEMSESPVAAEEPSAPQTNEKLESDEDHKEPAKEVEGAQEKPKPVLVIKEDPTIFNCNMDDAQETIKSEEQKHEKMNEIISNIVPKKFTLNFLDKIKGRLNDEVPEADDGKNSKPVELVINDKAVIPQSPCPESKISTDDASSVVADVQTPEIKKSDMEEPVKALEENTGSNTEILINNKNSVPIMNIIERLQGKLNMDTSQPPPLIPINEFNANMVESKSSEVTVQVGPIAAIKTDGCIQYICYMESCLYFSTSQSDLETHCKTLHAEDTWEGICSECSKNVGSIEIISAFNHLIEEHRSELGADEAKPDENAKPYIRMRRLSGDKLSELRDESMRQEKLGEKQPTEDSPFTIENVRTESTEEEPFNFPFQISSVVSLASEENEEPVDQAPLAVIPTVSSSSTDSPVLSNLAIISSTSTGLQSGTTSVIAPITFPLPLQVIPMLTPINKTLIPINKPQVSMVSDAPVVLPHNTLNPSSPTKVLAKIKINPKPQSKRIMLKDTPLHPEELVKPRKTRAATKSLLHQHKLIQLYKCPEQRCSYSTDSKKLFEAHLASHPEYKPGVQIPCLYCNFKTDFEYFGVHYDIRHGRCQYCCSYCVQFRALKQSYVEMHQEREHFNMPRRVIVVPINQDALMSQAQLQLPPLQNVIPLYVCGQLGCDQKFIFAESFKMHLNTAHVGVGLMCFSCQRCPANPSSAVIHMQSHNIHQLHCRYCPFGAYTMDELHKHLARQHFALAPKIVVRNFVAKNTVIKKTRDDCDPNDPTSFDYLEILSEEYKKYLSPFALVEAKNTLPVVSSKFTTYIASKPPEAVKISPKKTNMTLAFVEQLPSSSVTPDDVTPQSNSTEVIQVSDDEDKATKQNGDASRPSSPIILNKYLTNPSELLNLTKNLSSTGNIAPVAEQPKSFTPPVENVDVEEKATSNFVAVQNEPNITLDEPPSEDVDPLQLDSEPTENVPKENQEEGAQPSKLDSSFNNLPDDAVQEFSDLTPEEVSFSAEESTRKQGLTGANLFRCGYCKMGLENASLYKTHVARCVELNISTNIPRPFKCAHCVKTFKSLASLFDHVRLHGTLRFFCSLCDFKHQHQLYVRSHMKSKHRITSVYLTPVDQKKRSMAEDNFVVRPKLGRHKSIDGSSSGKDSATAGGSEDAVVNKLAKTTFGPDEIDELPLHPIFSQEVKCSVCGYQTKVRANITRHLRFHADQKEMPVPVTAPVNPVPCLEKNEKMFDKMTNLSLSSYKDSMRMASKNEKKDQLGVSKEEEALLPAFVPSNKRYVCGAPACDYLCLEESMLRCHLVALHSAESEYKCVHCSEALSTEKGLNAEFIIKHMRLHELHLYKCKYCKFVHQARHKVERHMQDKHPEKPTGLVVVRELENEPEIYEEVKGTKPWRCGMCKYRCTSHKDMAAHVFNKHEVESQFKCALCQFRSNDKSAFPAHFEKDHPNHQIDVIDAYYIVEETSAATKTVADGVQFDTTPLWQRDRYKFKHIRGIPLGETGRMSKKYLLKTNQTDSLDRAIEAVASGSSDITEKDLQKTKKPKTLKEKKMEMKAAAIENDVIEIDDDVTIKIEQVDAGCDDNSGLDMLKQADFNDLSQLNENLEEDSKSEPTLEEIKKMDIEMLRNSDLSGTYGPFGRPFNRYFLCPLCSVFKSKKVQEITQHLYKELRYFRFVCGSCKLQGITYGFLHRHSLRKHIMESIFELPVNKQIEDWVEKVLVIQRRLIEDIDSGGLSTAKSISSVSSGDLNTVDSKLEIEDFLDSANILTLQNPFAKKKILPGGFRQCQYCNYKCKSASDMRKHEIRHWVEKPYKCGYCEVEGVTKCELTQHSRRTHPEYPPLVIDIPIPSTPTIKPISRKRKYIKSKAGSASSSPTFEFTKVENEEEGEVDEDPLRCEDTTTENEEFFVFLCNYCPKRCSSEPELKSHWELTHKMWQPTFKFRKVMRSQLHKKGTLNYKCGYCDFISNREMIRKHILSDHPGYTFSVYRYKCSYCNQYFKISEKVRNHCRMLHNAEPSFNDIEIPPESATEQQKQNDFVCEYCETIFEGKSELLEHHKVFHSHLELNLPESAPTPSLALEQQESSNELKMYKCPQCHHTSNSYASMRDHVRGHAKPFACYHCGNRYTYPSFVRNHHFKEHPDLEFKCQAIDEAGKLNEHLRKNLLKLNENGVYEKILHIKGTKRLQTDEEDPGVSAKKFRIVECKEYAVVKKATARKSTTPRVISRAISSVDDDNISEGYSYYGCKPDLENLENVQTTVTFMGSQVNMNIAQFRGFLDISPVVLVADCMKHKTWL